MQKLPQMDHANWLCRCPDCRSPLTVREWLGIADCWRCGTSIGLAEIRERSARADSPAPLPPSSPAAAVMDGQRVGGGAGRVSRPPTARTAPAVPRVPLLFRQPAAPPLPRRRAAQPGLLSQLPAWLVSLLGHLVLLLLLGLSILPVPAHPIAIRLSATVGPQREEGGQLDLPSDEDQPAFDLPLPEDWAEATPERQEEWEAAQEEARSLRAVDDSQQLQPRQAFRLPATEQTAWFADRDPRVRVEVVRREGGTTLTEAAVARGLRWLAKHQHHDGRWRLHRFAEQTECAGRCDGESFLRSDSAATALALLPFLGAGQTDRQGIYAEQVRRGLAWLLAIQADDGDLRGPDREQPGMYAHGQATIVLSEAYALTGNPTLRDAAQRAVDFMVAAQHPAGGWRYHPGERGDTSVLGWQLMALQSARACGLEVPNHVWTRAASFLDQVQAADQISYSYQRGTPPTCVMTAEAILCRMFLGEDIAQPRIHAGLELLVRDYPPDRQDPNIYYWYYATQALHHAGGSLWKDWNRQMREILVAQQETWGHAAGSWAPRGPHSDAGGRIYQTSLAICILEVYYRHAPIFRPLAARPLPPAGHMGVTFD